MKNNRPVKIESNSKLIIIKEAIASTPWFRYGVDLAIAGFIALLYYFGAHIGLALVAKPEGVAAIWPPSGLLLGSLFVIGFRRWKIVIPIVFVTIVLANLSKDNTLLLSLAFATANCLESMAAAWFVLRVLKRPPQLDRLRDVWVFIGGAVIATNAITALLAALLIRLGTGGAFWAIWRLWWVEDGVGMLIVVPIVLSLVLFNPSEWSRRRSIDVLALVSVLVVASFWIFAATDTSSSQVFRFPYLLLPLMVLLALHGGSAGAACSAFIIASAAVWGGSRGTGIFSGWRPGGAADPIVAAQIFIAAISMTGIIVAALYGERQRAIENLRAILKEKTVLLDIAPVGIMKIIDRKIVWLNTKMEEVSQYSKADLDNQTTRIFYPSQEAFDQLEKEAFPVLQQGNLYETIQEFIRQDGSRILVRCIGKIIDPYDFSKGVLWFFEDVTEKKRAEEALRESEARLATIFRASPVAIGVNHFETGRFVDVNRSFCNLLGYSREEVIGRASSEFVLFVDSRERDQLIKELCLNGKASINAHVQRKSGEVMTFWMAAETVELKGEAHYVVVAADITQREKAEQEMARLLEQTERDSAIKGQLLLEINHRVKNNLIALRGLLLVEKRGAPKEGRSWTNIALDRVSDRVLGMITAHEMLSAFEWAPMPVEDLAQRVIGQVFKSCGVEARVYIDVSSTSGVVSPRQVTSLALILNELATNTLKYGMTKRKRTNISVQTDEDGDFLILHYRDDGPGYPEQILAGERANVGLGLVNDLAEGSLGGNLAVFSDGGAVSVIRIRKEALSYT
jgi:PAS domain S-box-containing protein